MAHGARYTAHGTYHTAHVIRRTAHDAGHTSHDTWNTHHIARETGDDTGHMAHGTRRVCIVQHGASVSCARAWREYSAVWYVCNAGHLRSTFRTAAQRGAFQTPVLPADTEGARKIMPYSARRTTPHIR